VIRDSIGGIAARVWRRQVAAAMFGILCGAARGRRGGGDPRTCSSKEGEEQSAWRSIRADGVTGGRGRTEF
jgi:hypothetical protein